MQKAATSQGNVGATKPSDTAERRRNRKRRERDLAWCERFIADSLVARERYGPAMSLVWDQCIDSEDIPLPASVRPRQGIKTLPGLLVVLLAEVLDEQQRRQDLAEILRPRARGILPDLRPMSELALQAWAADLERNRRPRPSPWAQRRAEALALAWERQLREYAHDGG